MISKKQKNYIESKLLCCGQAVQGARLVETAMKDKIVVADEA